MTKIIPVVFHHTVSKLAVFIAIMTVNQALAQPSVNWKQQVSGDGWQQVIDLVTDASGNIYALGGFQGNTVIGADESAAEIKPADVNGIFVAKFDPSGQLTWTKHLSGNGGLDPGKLDMDPFGNLYFCGNFSPNLFVTGDPYTDTLTCSREGKDNTFICKLTTDGTVLWLKHFESKYHNDPGDFAVDSKGNLLVLGRFETNIDLDPGPGTTICKISEYETSVEWPSANYFETFIVSLDSGGNLVWSHHLAATGDVYGYGMALDANDNIYCTGDFDGSLYVYDQPAFPSLYTSSGSGPFLLKIDASGKVIGNRCIAGNDDYVSPGDLKVDRYGDIYLTGIFRNNASFKKDDPEFSISNGGDIDFFVCRLDNKGDVEWVRSYGGTSSDHSFDLTIDDQGNIYITGEASSPECFEQATGQKIKDPGGEEMFVLKLDNNGNFQWVMTAGGDNQNWVYTACWDKLAGLVVGGFCSSSQIEFGGHKFKSTGSADGFIFGIGDLPLKK